MAEKGHSRDCHDQVIAIVDSSKLTRPSANPVFLFRYFMFTYITTTTVASLVELQDFYQVSFAQMLWTVALPALGLAAGPVFWTSFADIYGRRIIFIIGSLICIGATIGAALADNYSGYMAARFFQGFGVSPAAVVGLAIITDLYFDHERGQKVGFWVLALDTGLLVGPLIGGFLNLVSPQWIQWFSAIVFAVLLALELSLMPETLYPRNRMLKHLSASRQAGEKESVDLESVQQRHSDASQVDLRRTRKLAFLNVRPVPGMRHPMPWDSIVRLLKTFKFAVVVIAVFTYCFIWYWWMLSVITIIPVAYADYEPHIQGLLFIGLLLGTLVAELFFSGRLSDVISKRLAKKRGHHVRLAEDRLWLAYPAALLTAVGLIVWGISIDQEYHWMVGQVAFFLFAAGIQIGNTACAAYVVDAYPLQSVSMIVFYSVWINLSAFINPVQFSTMRICVSSQTDLFLAGSFLSSHGRLHLVSLGALLPKESLSSSAQLQLSLLCRNGDRPFGTETVNQAGLIPSSIHGINYFDISTCVGGQTFMVVL